MVAVYGPGSVTFAEDVLWIGTAAEFGRSLIHGFSAFIMAFAHISD